ncbi:MAG: S41 family peptidase [Candidatus Paceibacterota bacterium]|jgi:carboxyl-terminal processing protease|nr:S41 family peptidase [Candidatus Paceibacterota bacterium]MDD5555583.1 S41 family peptidase [Candidatus Paceibacterota bacterium]
MNKYISKNVIVILLIGLSFFGGFFFDKFIHEKEYKAAFNLDGMDLTLLKEVYEKTVFNFVDPTKIDKKKLTYGAVAGMVEAIGDPYTTFFDPNQAKDFQDDLSGIFEGVGIQIGVKDNQIKVIAPLKGTPAEAAGILAGDAIIEVDGRSTAEMSIDEVVSKIKGEKGTKVTLTISRTRKGEAPETKTFEIVRDVIKVPTIEWKMTEKDGKQIAYLTIYHFSEYVFDDFKKAAYEILSNNFDGIVLDLRNNPGGLLNRTVDIAGWFLEKGSVVLTEQNKNLEKTNYKASGPASFANTPMVILINEGTASSAEILTGALKDNRNILVVGETSFGKGLVQRVVTLEDGSTLKVTTAKWYTPNGELIQDVGIKPDIEVEMTGDDYSEDKDPQLDRALEEMVKIINQ